jgi:hypothetical protein
MKRISAIASLLFVSALALAAAVWDGSAVAGVAGDFPDDGYYGACNSFPRDTSVTVTNLENGKSVTVAITRSVDNPGVFIALSPKAASQLGMRAGTATRIRAVALVASQAESSLPPTRAGESADPDYNPKVYVEREKAAAAAAASAPLAAPLASSQAPTQPVAASPAAAVPSAFERPAAPESAEVLAKVGEPKKQQAEMPALTEPKTSAAMSAPAAAAKPASVAAVAPAAATQAAPAAVVAAVPSEKPKQSKTSVPASPKPEASSTYPGSPRSSAVGMELPPPALPAAAAAQTPEIVGGEQKPSPRKSAAPRLVYIEPPLPSAKGTEKPAAVAKEPEKASVDGLKRPSALAGPYGFALAEPKPEFVPDQLPDAVLSRVIAPTKVVPNPVLAEAETPRDLGDLRTKPEAIACERPSYAEAVEAALAEALVVTPAEAYAINEPAKAKGEGSSAELAEAGLPGSPEALAADRKAARASGALAELQTPDVPRPVEGLAGDKPAGVVGVAAVGSLDEPGVSTPSSTGTGPIAVAENKKGPAESSTGELNEPEVPSPTESLARGNAKSVAPEQAVALLAEPDPSGKGTAAIAAEKPAKAATPGTGDLASPAVPSPTESLAAEHPEVVAGGERAVTLEPATPRPPVSATAAPAAAAAAAVPAAASSSPAASMVPAKPSPSTVATVTSPRPAGALQPPASVPVLKGLAKGSYYVQIGVYGTNDALNSAIAGFKSSHYPLAVEKLTTKKGEAAYRLFVGPLSRDESGLVLIRIRSLGYKDAYIREGT